MFNDNDMLKIQLSPKALKFFEKKRQFAQFKEHKGYEKRNSIEACFILDKLIPGLRENKEQLSMLTGIFKVSID